MISNDDAIEDLIKRVKAKSRFDSMDNSIAKLTPTEYTVAVESALDVVNAFEPVTVFTLEQIYNNPKYLSTMRNILVDLAIRELVYTLMFDWLANSEESETIEMFTVSSKYSQYNALYDQLWSANEAKLTAIKKAVGVVIRGSSYATDYAIKISSMSYRVNLIARLQKSLRGTML